MDEPQIPTESQFLYRAMGGIVVELIDSGMPVQDIWRANLRETRKSFGRVEKQLSWELIGQGWVLSKMTWRYMEKVKKLGKMPGGQVLWQKEPQLVRAHTAYMHGDKKYPVAIDVAQQRWTIIEGEGMCLVDDWPTELFMCRRAIADFKKYAT